VISCKPKNSELDSAKFQTYKRINGNKTWGFVNQNGDTIIPLNKYKFLNPIDEEGMILAHKNGKDGYIDINEKILIPFEFDDIGVFSEGLAPVRKTKNGKEGYINRKGEIIIDFQFDNASYFYKNGVAEIQIANKIGYINKEGDRIIPAIYDYGIHTKSDDFVVVSKNEKLAFFSNKGEQKTKFEFDKVFKHSENKGYVVGANGLILVEKSGQFAYLDSNFNIVVPYGKYDNAFPFNANHLAIVQENKKYGIIDSLGTLIIPLKYDLIEHPAIYSNIFAEFLTNDSGKYGLLDSNGDTLLENKYEEIIWDRLKRGENQQKYFIYKENGKFGAINTKGEIIIPFEYEQLSNFKYQDFTIAKKNGKFGVINSFSETIIPFEYNTITCNERKQWCNLLILEKDGNVGLADLKGQLKISSIYQEISPCFYDETNRFIVKKSNLFGIIDIDENIIIPIEYDEISNWVEYGPDEHFVTKNKKKGLISREGKIVIPPIYDEILVDNSKLIKVKKNSLFGTINWKNEIVHPIEYEQILWEWPYLTNKELDTIYLKKNGKYFSTDTKGNVLEQNVNAKVIDKKFSYILNYR
jgi:hypothetical protein